MWFKELSAYGRLTPPKLLGIMIRGWWIDFTARRRMRKLLGRKISDAELSSLRMWEKTVQAEKKTQSKSTQL